MGLPAEPSFGPYLVFFEHLVCVKELSVHLVDASSQNKCKVDILTVLEMSKTSLGKVLRHNFQTVWLVRHRAEHISKAVEGASLFLPLLCRSTATCTKRSVDTLYRT